MKRIRAVMAAKNPPAKPLEDVAKFCAAVQANLAEGVFDPAQHRQDCADQHRVIWQQWSDVDDAIRHKFYKRVRGGPVSIEYQNATMEALRATKDLLHKTMEALAGRIAAIDSLFQSQARAVHFYAGCMQPAAAAGGAA